MADNNIQILEEKAEDFKKNLLPSNSEVIKAIYYKHYSHSVSYKIACKFVASCIAVIWQRSDIPVLNLRSIENKVQTFFDDFYKLATSDKSRKSFEIKFNTFNVNIAHSNFFTKLNVVNNSNSTIFRI